MKGYIAFITSRIVDSIYIGREPERSLKLFFKEQTSKLDEGIRVLVMLCFEVLQGWK